MKGTKMMLLGVGLLLVAVILAVFITIQMRVMDSVITPPVASPEDFNVVVNSIKLFNYGVMFSGGLGLIFLVWGYFRSE